jgi:hypothetical protein
MGISPLNRGLLVLIVNMRAALCRCAAGRASYLYRKTDQKRVQALEIGLDVVAPIGYLQVAGSCAIVKKLRGLGILLPLEEGK